MKVVVNQFLQAVLGKLTFTPLTYQKAMIPFYTAVLKQLLSANRLIMEILGH